MRSSGLAVGSAAMTIATSLLPGYEMLERKLELLSKAVGAPTLAVSSEKVAVKLIGVRQSEAGSGSPPSSPKIPPRPQSRGKAEVERGEEREQGVTGRAGAESSGRREHQRLGYLDSGQKNLSRINKGSLSAHRSFATPKCRLHSTCSNVENLQLPSWHLFSSWQLWTPLKQERKRNQ
ncbi:hypothetical protein MJT46_006199, partial [Ovis ammon polii x Ovis aries]